MKLNCILAGKLDKIYYKSASKSGITAEIWTWILESCGNHYKSKEEH